MNAHVSLDQKKWHYVEADGTLKKYAIRAEIDRRVKREWALLKGESSYVRRSETRFVLAIALQQRDAVLAELGARR